MKRLLLLSKFPLKPESDFKFTADPAILRTQIKINNQWIHFLIMHSTRPSSGKVYHAHQIQQFKEIAFLVNKVKTEPFVMMGDLNTTPWGYSFRKLLKETNLINSMNGFGFQTTFPAFIIYKSKHRTKAFLPIDHILINKDFTVLKRQIGNYIDSDHLPVYLELSV